MIDVILSLWVLGGILIFTGVAITHTNRKYGNKKTPCKHSGMNEKTLLTGLFICPKCGKEIII